MSKDGRWLAYAISASGSDWQTWHVRDADTGQDLPETLEWSKFSGAAWRRDGSGFYYARYPAPAEGQTYADANYNQRIFPPPHPMNTPGVCHQPGRNTRADVFGSAPRVDSRWQSSEQFKTLYAYSPLHNLKPGSHYPATLITTGDHDDRVVPGHSFKFAAALQSAQAGDRPTLIRIQTKAGHGLGKPTAILIAERADIYAFLARALAVKDRA